MEANEQLGLAVDLREYKQCAEILFDLGLCKVRVVSNNPLKLRALEEAGLRVVERISIEVEPTEKAAGYLRTKKEKLGHFAESQYELSLIESPLYPFMCGIQEFRHLLPSLTGR